MSKSKTSDRPFEEIAWQWLRRCGLRIDKQFLSRELRTHADYPALVSLIDFLDLGKMSYYAIESTMSGIPQFKYPLLAHVRHEQSEYMQLVGSPADWTTNQSLLADWTGIVLFPDGKPVWQNGENTRILKQKKTFSLLAMAAILVLSIGAGYLLRHELDFRHIAWGILSLAGLALSGITIATELGIQIRAVGDVCDSFGSHGCEAVLKSPYAAGIGGVSVADMALAWFAAQCLFFAGSVRMPVLLSALPITAILLLPIGLASLYLQKFRLKKWCALCLGIVIVIVLQGILALLYAGPLFKSPSLAGLAGFVFTIFLLIAGWIPLKRFFKSIRAQLDQATELQLWKRDPALFIAQWQQSPAADTDLWPEELQFGNPDAPLQITVACQPYCGPCAGAHVVLDELFHTYPDLVNIRVRLMCIPEISDRRMLAVTAILRGASGLNNNGAVAQLLADWFAFRDLEKWQRKWGKGDNNDVSGLVIKHAAWMKKADITGTPTIFINGHQLPKKYTVTDLLPLVPQLAMQMPGLD